MKKILVTGGTVFVSRYAAEYFAKKGDEVFVLNRNNRPQPKGVTLIEADRNHLGNILKNYHFDVVLDITAYTKEDVEHLVTALGSVERYILVSSGAVYPETLPLPFSEEQECDRNEIWGDYGLHKLEAEQYLLERVPQAYVLRPPYLYGPMQNLYREPFVFECANLGRPFYVPKDGRRKIQFFHVEDLCRFMEILLEKKPKNHIFNVGNPKLLEINEWVALCYEAAGKQLTTRYVDESHPVRNYFCFHDYEYELNVAKQSELMPEVKPLAEGLKESYAWYMEHQDMITRKPYLEYIDREIEKLRL